VIEQSAAHEVDRVVRLSTVVCLVAAVVSIVVASLAGRPSVGAVLAAGIVIGSANAHMVQRLVRLGVPLVATSLMRIMTLTAAAAAVGLLIGLSNIWLIVAGLGVAQLIMSGSALREMNRR
jgi:hypothetical protein